jgi:hypothetical protein
MLGEGLKKTAKNQTSTVNFESKEFDERGQIIQSLWLVKSIQCSLHS